MFHFSMIYHEHVLVKEPSARIPTPWHHDQAYYPIDGDDICSIWMPVDPVPVESTVKFVKGSHAWNQWFFPRKFKTAKNYELTSLDNANLSQFTVDYFAHFMCMVHFFAGNSAIFV